MKKALILLVIVAGVNAACTSLPNQQTFIQSQYGKSLQEDKRECSFEAHKFAYKAKDVSEFRIENESWNEIYQECLRAKGYKLFNR